MVSSAAGIPPGITRYDRSIRRNGSPPGRCKPAVVTIANGHSEDGAGCVYGVGPSESQGFASRCARSTSGMSLIRAMRLPGQTSKS